MDAIQPNEFFGTSPHGPHAPLPAVRREVGGPRPGRISRRRSPISRRTWKREGPRQADIRQREGKVRQSVFN